ncbi:xanthine dehydrogenase family protein subunit M [Caballeronia mineralivorans]|jgi:carbon-monoxide dehydrogenase medium subunit|uniref:FAD binding domain-containing protein n=1 Tax=Caballeronia mineralivorans TaxID=2010198 RepID=UPI002AFFDD90|nr:xanthine dehydrogenase family protein subunit M [Caballeronia mineralivorans]MEA3103163.1 aerobic carbon-monoxide dehydrogenase medium subunit [Caballeronia mineralivorans]
MIPYDFEYVRPTTVADAVALLSNHPDAKLLAGGHSLLPIMKLRLARPSMLIDVTHVPELRRIEVNDDSVIIGAGLTHAELEADSRLRDSIPLFGKVAEVIADPAVRNRGTIGGSLVNADPSADWPAAMLALEAEMEIVGPTGSRRVPATNFFEGVMASAVQPDELLTRIIVPVLTESVCGYRKFRHPASGYAVAAAAVVLRYDREHCIDGRIGITGVADAPFNARAAETLLGTAFEGRLEQICEIAAVAVDGVVALEDGFADSSYRLQLARTMVERALADALKSRTSNA